ncbi:MAG TPA: hypothetical protein VHH14_09680, partial [Solirubrobacterales bacterium]|nr:hypothetical protein [Solirubrobacterales bacterium]
MNPLARRSLVSILLLVAVATVAAGSGAHGQRPVLGSDGNMQMTFGADFSPRPVKAKPARMAFWLSARFFTADGSSVPNLRRLIVESEAYLDRRLLDVPRCEPPEPSATEADWNRCKKAIVGLGFVDSMPRSPGGRPVNPEGDRLTAYNAGSVAGGWKLWLRYQQADAATDSSAVGQLRIKRTGSGPYRLRLVLTLPRALKESAYVNYLTVPLYGVFGASCPDRRLAVRATAVFAEGSRPAAETRIP